MSNVLVALSNDNIFNMIKEIGGEDIHSIDISYKEGVIEYLANNKIEKIITKDSLEGNMTKEIFIKQIKLAAPDIKVVLFVKNLTEIYKNFLLSNGVYNILESDVVDMEILEKAILGDDNIIYMDNFDKGHQAMENQCQYGCENNLNMRVITKKNICVFGTNGSGKSYISSILGNIISRKLRLNTLVVDLDIQNPSIDIYNNLEFNNNTLEGIVNNIDNQELDTHIVPQLSNKSNNLWYITNNGNNNLQERIGYRHYETIKDFASSKYDVVIYDNNESMFFDSVHFSAVNSDIVFFVINPNYISIRQAEKNLNILVNLWKIDKEKIKIIINKSTSNSLSNQQIESFLSGHKIFMNIPYNGKVENIINGLENISNIHLGDEDNICNLFGIRENKRNIKEIIRNIGVRV